MHAQRLAVLVSWLDLSVAAALTVGVVLESDCWLPADESTGPVLFCAVKILMVGRKDAGAFAGMGLTFLSFCKPFMSCWSTKVGAGL